MDILSVIIGLLILYGLLWPKPKSKSTKQEYTSTPTKRVGIQLDIPSIPKREKRTAPFTLKTHKSKHIDYSKYITSADWKFNSNRLAVLEYDNRCCRLCKDNYNIQVHHITYDNLGSEEFEDLITLCEPCHTYTHTVAGKGAKTYPPIKA